MNTNCYEQCKCVTCANATETGCTFWPRHCAECNGDNNIMLGCIRYDRITNKDAINRILYTDETGAVLASRMCLALLKENSGMKTINTGELQQMIAGWLDAEV